MGSEMCIRDRYPGTISIDPACPASELPDRMVISPVFDEVLSPDCNVTIPDAAPDSDAFDPIDTEPVLVDDDDPLSMAILPPSPVSEPPAFN